MTGRQAHAIVSVIYVSDEILVKGIGLDVKTGCGGVSDVWNVCGLRVKRS